jgi:hypothetical protein
VSEIINKVSQSGLQTLNLEDLYTPGERVVFDLRPLLFQDLILREKDFREFIKSNDWSQFQDKLVAVTCSTDAIVPTWAYMLISIALEPYAKTVFYGTIQEMETFLFVDQLSRLDLSQYKDQKVVVKGCGDIPVPTNAFVQVARLLRPHVKSIMYGEPCSTVPLYKSKSV